MVKTIDYYEHWNKVRGKKEGLLDREIKSVAFIDKIIKENDYFLDAGCGNGDFLVFLRNKYKKVRLKGIDFSSDEVREARKKGLDVTRGDFEKSMALKNSSFDIIYAGEVIEHLYNPDSFLEQMNKALKKNSYLIITTPNLCSWYNRMLMPLGIQPMFLEPSTKSKLVGAGILKRFKIGEQPVGHIRIFTLEALKDLLKMNGFGIIDVKGAIYDEGLPKKLWAIDRLFNTFPKLASHLVILAMKI